MNHKVLLLQMTGLTLVTLLSAGCGALASIPILPTATPTATATPTPVPVPQTPTTEQMGVLPSNYQEGSLAISDDGEKHAFVVQAAGGQRAVVDGGEEELFSQVSSPKFSPTTDRLFYWALDEALGEQRIVLVADGKVIPTDFAGEGSLRFSQDGKRWAAIGGEPTGQNVFVFSDGTQVGQYSDASYPAFSPDGEHLAYLIRDDSSEISLVIDGDVQTTYEEPQVASSDPFRAYISGPNLPPLFSVTYLTDGSLLILTQDQNGWTVYKNDQPISSYPHNIWGGGNLTVIRFDEFETSASILASSVNIAEDAPVAVWWERLEGDEEQWRVVRDGQPVDDTLCTSFWDLQAPVLSADGRHAAYPCISESAENDEDEIFVVADGTKYGPYVHVWGITFSKNGEHFAYAASDGSDAQAWSYYVDGEPYSLKYDAVWPPRLSLDGAHIAWAAQRGDEVILAVDAQEMGSGDENLWGPAFDESGDVVWIARKGNEIVRLTTSFR